MQQPQHVVLSHDRAQRQRGVLLRDDRSRVRKKQIAAAIQQHVDLPHVPVTDHCAAAAGRQGCSAVCSWG